MATSTTYFGGSIATLLDTQLNSLANNALAIGTAYTMSPAGYLLAEVELVATYGVAPTANTGVSVWFLRAIDAANYEDGDASTTPARPPDVVLPVRAVTSAQRVTRRCVVPPGTWKPLLKNDGTGQTMAASGNTLKVLPLTFQQA
jgi:acyl-coenzyme A thioesterase PaaI-like protein